MMANRQNAPFNCKRCMMCKICETDSSASVCESEICTDKCGAGSDCAAERPARMSLADMILNRQSAPFNCKRCMMCKICETDPDASVCESEICTDKCGAGSDCAAERPARMGLADMLANRQNAPFNCRRCMMCKICKTDNSNSVCASPICTEKCNAGSICQKEEKCKSLSPSGCDSCMRDDECVYNKNTDT